MINRHKVAKYFTPEITETSVSYRHDDDRINKDASLDGFYVIRTSVSPKSMSPEEIVNAYKSLSRVERAFR